MDDIEPEVDAIFAAPPDEFVAARDALVKQLRAEKRRDDATAVKSLRRPTVSAWAMNQLARRDGDRLEELLTVAQALRDEQARAISGGGGSLRDAARRFGELVDALADRAAAIVVADGVATDGRRDELAAALRTAAADPEWWDDLRRGRLSRLPEVSADFDMWSAGAEPANVNALDTSVVQFDAAERRQSRSERAAENARVEVERLEGEVGALEARLEAARERLRDARDQHSELVRAVKEGERELARLRRKAGRS